jgi:hypothetical protein
MRKADIDGNSATFFFCQPVGINAGESLYQRGFSMIDVPGRADDYGLHRTQYSCRLGLSMRPIRAITTRP